jgi:hypothetical protein
MISFKTFISELAINRGSAAKALKRNPGAKVGFEFEFAVPQKSDLFLDDRTEENTISLRTFDDLEELRQSFDASRRLINTLESEFAEWKEEQKQNWVDGQLDDEDDEEARADAYERSDDHVHIELSDWIEDTYGDWRRLISSNGLSPEYGWADDRDDDRATFYNVPVDPDGYATRERVAEALEQWLGTKVMSAESSSLSYWTVLPDSSVEGGVSAEIVSPPLPFAASKEAIDEVFKFAFLHDLVTNESTGLHVNISIPNMEDLDLVKLMVFMGDEHALEVFGRSKNTNTPSQMQRIRQAFDSWVANRSDKGFHQMPGVNDLISFAEDQLSYKKYNSINLLKLQEGYMEIRIAGGDYLKKKTEIEQLIDRALTAIDIAADPRSNRELYIKKLSQVFGDAKANVLGSGPVTLDKRAARYSGLQSYLRDLQAVINRAKVLQGGDIEKEMDLDDRVTRAAGLVVGLAGSTSGDVEHLTSSQAIELLKIIKALKLTKDQVIKQSKQINHERVATAFKKLGL